MKITELRTRFSDVYPNFYENLIHTQYYLGIAGNRSMYSIRKMRDCSGTKTCHADPPAQIPGKTLELPKIISEEADFIYYPNQAL